MIIYITGASGVGKTTILKSLKIKGVDLDDVYAANWDKHKTFEKVQSGVKKDIESLISKHKNIVFVGLQSKEQLVFSPDLVIILTRVDYENMYRQKLVRDLKLLCENKKDYEEVFTNEPFDEFRKYFWSNSVVNMKSLDEFKKEVVKQSKIIKKDFPDAHVLTAKEAIEFLSINV